VVLLHGIDRDGDGVEGTPLDAFGEEIARLGATVFRFGWQTSGGWSSLSADDLSCMGPFVQARAVEYGADPDKVVIVGFSMGGEAASNLAFRSFQLSTDAICTEIGPNPRAAAFVGIGGSYGWIARPVPSDPDTFMVPGARCNDPPREASATDEVGPGLTAEQGYELDGYSSMQLADSNLEVVLVVGSLDPWRCTGPDVTISFADALSAEGIDVEVVTVEGANHENVVDPATEHGQKTLQVIADILTNTR
jgi:acetyl esterase/lipase